MSGKKNLIGKIRRITNDKTVISSAVFANFLSAHNLDYRIIGDLEKYSNNIQFNKLIEILDGEVFNDIPDLIDLLEFLVFEDEAVKRGVVYTPQIVNDILISEVDRFMSPHVRICDPSCGCGSIMYSVSKKIHEAFNISYTTIYSSILYGIDVDADSVYRTKLLFATVCLLEEKALPSKTNLFVANSLDRRFIENFTGYFDVVIGNPPYVRNRNLSPESKEHLRDWNVSSVGNVDLYIPFFEIGLLMLKDSGVLSYITPDTYIQSLNARALRQMLNELSYEITIIDFRDVPAFSNKSNYTSITTIDKSIQNNNTNYCRVSELMIPDESDFTSYSRVINLPYSPWRYCNSDIDANIQIMESFPTKLESYGIKNGLATLANSIFFFKPVDNDAKYYYLKNRQGEKFAIEKEVCVDIVKPNILHEDSELLDSIEKAIFPYKLVGGSYVLIPELDFKKSYPRAYFYLELNKELLLKRDRGKAVTKYPAWYAYGRTQGMDNYGKKVLLPYMAGTPVAIYSSNPDLLFYCGYALFSEDEKELKVLQRILRSSVFWYYVYHSSKPYAKGFRAFAKNYIKNFSIPIIDDYDSVLEMSDSDFENYIKSAYGVHF